MQSLRRLIGIGGREHRADHRYTMGSSGHNLRQVVMIDTANSQNWNGDLTNDCGQLLQPLRGTIGDFRRGSKNWSEDNKICPLSSSLLRLCQTMRGYTDELLRPKEMPCPGGW
jgi:hypothetical protein